MRGAALRADGERRCEADIELRADRRVRHEC
jgi:hypothetical protein